MRIVKSQRKKDQIVDENDFIYEKKKINANSIRWRCIIPGCRSIATTSIDFRNQPDSFFLKTPHDENIEHPNSATKKILIAKMKDEICISDRSPRSILYSSLRGANAETVVYREIPSWFCVL